ncbi:aminoglycoside phosphotransferase family protein [Microbacterium sp. H1-D42]|uniref:aminoglycoside phosphotransferase family protein n=1 Tax=Microbacterium sp. H1-D42 TaxID=2925844 RepID=UPI001F53878A|nr:aminoglycoside phosphotransferase family protein [Microbacterium sp. H1-D42]UNK71964.1 aminoglycoside phosphotransferase family protein [Microbacterium sp. H1-D42]
MQFARVVWEYREVSRPVDIDERVVAELVEEQFPRWAGMPVRAVARQGWDNRTFRLGDDLSVRLPSAESYAAGVQKESRALDFFDGRLPVSVPSVVALGAPGPRCPFPWSIRRWLAGDTVDESAGLDRVRLGIDLGSLLRALMSLPIDAGTAAGRHSFYRGSHPSAYSEEVQAALDHLHGKVDTDRCRSVWLAATTSAWDSAPVWFHGDVAVGNLLVSDGRLSAMIDFGTCGVGDPACDLVMAWTYFEGEARDAFRDAVGLDVATWRRARGWALWKALVTLADGSGSGDDDSWRVLDEVLASPL